MADPPRRPRNLDEAAGLVEPGKGEPLSESVVVPREIPGKEALEGFSLPPTPGAIPEFKMPRLGWRVLPISNIPAEEGFDDALALALAPELNGDTSTGNPHFDPNGNPTQWGIDKTQHPLMDVGNLSRMDAIMFYLEHPAMWPMAKKVPGRAADLRTVYFEGLINAGRNATKALQMAVGTNPDGNYGPETSRAVKTALNTRGEEKVVREYFIARKARYDAIVRANPQKHAKNRKGWHNRVDDTADYYEHVLKARRQGAK